MAVSYVPYFIVVGFLAPDEPIPHQLVLYAGAVCVQLAILGLGHLFFRRRWPQDAGVAPDERDRAIANRGMTSAYYVLIAGTIVVGCIMPLTEHGWAIVGAALFAIVAAEFVHYGVVATLYRRQA